ncbi:MAG: GNAT family N-acetyltransferase [Planctomycetota bacterium]|jgi:CelD/BcsL family acetyltransferase involved in cellulose biosynthesis
MSTKHNRKEPHVVSETPVNQGALQLRCYSSFQQAEHLRQSWDSLAQQLDGDISASFDWCDAWWRHFGKGRSLELYIATIENELIAVLPLFRENIHWGPLALRVIRIVGSDHVTTTCNITVQPARLDEVIQAIMIELNRNGAWDIIHLGDMPGYARYATDLAEALRRSPHTGKVVFRDSGYPHMVFDLPDHFDEFLASLSTKERRNVRRDERRWNHGSVNWQQPANPQELDKVFDLLIRLHTTNWVDRGRLGHFRDWPGIEHFHREVSKHLLRQNRLMIVGVQANGEPVAMEYGVRFGRRLSWIIGGRSQNVTGRIGYCAIVRWALAAGVTQIDALPGYYNYKRRLGARVLTTKTIRVMPPRISSLVRMLVFKSATWLIDFIYHRAWFWHFAPWLRRAFPKIRISWLWAGLWPRFTRARFLIDAKSRYRESLTQPKGLA